MMMQTETAGWDGLEYDPEKLKKQVAEIAREEDEKRRREARIFADCFATEAGQRCLELLRAKTIDRPPTVDELAERDAEAFALMASRRQGAANLVFQILSALDYARGIEKEETNA